MMSLDRMVLSLLLGGLSFGLVPAALAQDAGFSSNAKPKLYIVYVAEPQAITAAKTAVIELHFKVQDGFHVNSHTPKSEYLIPTKLTLDPATGVRPGPTEYPAGTTYSFSFEPNEKLDVYSGDFTLKVPVVAAAGEHRVTGTLHYQACDHAACYPPKTLPVEILFTAK